MENNEEKTLQYFTIIGGQKNKDKYINLLLENNAKLIDTMYGKSSVNKSFIAKAFGFDTEEKKILVTCLVPTVKARELIEILKTKYNFGKPNTGIAFTIPVEGLIF